MSEVYWAAEAPAAELADRVDVAIVGAGFAGLSIGLDLLEAEPGLRVAIIEARHAGFGASGRNAGAVLPLVLPWLLPRAAGGHNAREAQRLLCARVGVRLDRLMAEHPAGQIRPVRMLLIGANRVLAAGLGWAADAIAAAGIAVEHWSGAEVTAACGAPARSGIALAAWSIQPAALAGALAARFTAAGGALLEQTPVSAVLPAGDGVEVRLAGGRRLRAGRAVICTGPYTAGIDVPDRPRARVLHTYMRASEPLPDRVAAALGGEELFMAAPGPGMPYWRVHGGRLLFGGLDVGGLDPGPVADARVGAHRAVDRLLRRRLPSAVRYPPEFRWGGPLHVTPAGVPHLECSAASERIVYAVGFAGSGVALTLSAGPLVRDLVVGPAHADQEAVLLRQAMRATRAPWRGLLGVR